MLVLPDLSHGVVIIGQRRPVIAVFPGRAVFRVFNNRQRLGEPRFGFVQLPAFQGYLPGLMIDGRRPRVGVRARLRREIRQQLTVQPVGALQFAGFDTFQRLGA